MCVRAAYFYGRQSSSQVTARDHSTSQIASAARAFVT